jgi:tetratricopeptide (TPR) repeat protein
MATRDGPDRALQMFERAIALDPDYAEAWAGLGGAYALKGASLSMPEMLDKAIDAEKRALAIDPSMAEASTWLGAALLGKGQAEEAIAILQAAVQLEPNHARAYQGLARAHWIGRGDFKPAIEALEKGVSINPQFGYAYLQLALLYSETGEFAKAEAAARHAIELQEQYISGEEGLLIVGAHTRLGYVYYRQGRYEDAVKEYQSELVFLSASDHWLKDRSLIELHQKMGAAYLRLGQDADAKRHFKVALRGFDERVARGADDPQTKYYIAIIYALKDDAERAVRYLTEVAAALPNLTRARAASDPDLENVRAALKAAGLIS